LYQRQPLNFLRLGFFTFLEQFFGYKFSYFLSIFFAHN
jgi:hypothetical protein